MASLQEIVSSLKNPQEEDRELISRAYEFAEKAHKNQTRLSGEPYLTHLSETAKILAEYGMGATTVAAGLLHDSIEDVGVEPENIKREFDEEILFLVEGVTKLGKLKYQGTDRHNESLRKLLVAMSQDIRVLMIKLCDRLHNLRTLEYVPKEKQKRIAGETLEIYAPIAYRLGIRKLSRELEDLSFPYVYPKEYENLQKEIKKHYQQNLESVEKFLKSIKKALAKEDLTNLRTEYRVKGIWSIFQKMRKKKVRLEEIFDVLAIRIITKEVSDCYRVLGIIHGSWQPLPQRIKDYIAFPKPNGYQSLHTTVFTGDGSVVEVQIRTEAMHRDCEYGITSHISYKSGKGSKKPESLAWAEHLLPKQRGSEHLEANKDPRDVPRWIRDLVEHHSEEPDPENFKERLKADFFEHRIFAFSPKGDVVDLPIGSSPIDFAYAIHSDIGNHMFGAKVNNKLVSLDTPLKNGDIVEIIDRPNSKPTTKWVEYAKTTNARKHIRSALSKNKKTK